MQPYLYESNKDKELNGHEAIVMLPDIYCQTDYSKQTVEKFAEAFEKPVFMLDYFYLLTSKANNLSDKDREIAQSLMKGFDANKFITFFQQALEDIKSEYPNIKSFIVIGFCFGGRLAYIAGGEESVSKVISFYGGGALTPNYVQGLTTIDYLTSRRNSLKVDSFFGTNDPSIPESDRKHIKDKLIKGGLSYEAHEYDAGHAYFQEGRPNFNASASQASWNILKSIV